MVGHQQRPIALHLHHADGRRGTSGHHKKGHTAHHHRAHIAWVINAITKGTITFDYKNLGKLPQLINAGIASTTTGLRYMADATANSNTVLTAPDASSRDSKAQVSGTISNSDLTVDSATATTVPNPNIYIDSLNSATVKTTISSSFVQMSLSLIMVMIFGLLF